MTFAVLVVCTGNICRSAAAEQALVSRLEGRRGVEVMSAGTHALDGAPMHRLTRDALTAAGLAPSPHSAQRLGSAMVAVSDLVLTATRAHRVAVVENDPAAARRTFTLLEFARLLRHVRGSVDRLDDLVDVVAAERGRMPATAADDLADPVRGSLDVHVSMLRTLLPAIDSVADALSRPTVVR